MRLQWWNRTVHIQWIIPRNAWDTTSPFLILDDWMCYLNGGEAACTAGYVDHHRIQCTKREGLFVWDLPSAYYWRYQKVLILVLGVYLIQGFSEHICARFSIIVCDWIINVQINESTCDFCQIFLLDKRCSNWFAKKYQIYICCIDFFMSLFILSSQSIIGEILPNLWRMCLEKPVL